MVNIDKFSEVKKFVDIMSEEFRAVQVMKIKTKDAKWLVDEVEKLRHQQALLIAELEKADKFSDELKAQLFRYQLPDMIELTDKLKEGTE